MTTTEAFPEGERWYCVRAKPKKEHMAASSIAGMHGLEVFCPRIRFRRKTARGPVWFQEAMFPGYFFCRFDLGEMKRAVSFAPNVMSIPMFNDRYVPVPDGVIEGLKADLEDGDVTSAAVPLAEGDETVVLEGSMRGLKVKVIRVLESDDRVAVLLEMLGTLVEAEFSTDALEHRVKHKAPTD